VREGADRPPLLVAGRSCAASDSVVPIPRCCVPLTDRTDLLGGVISPFE
jgi:hypothetical protein